MAVTTPFIGRLGRMYLKLEGASTYGTAPTFASTDVVRNLDLDLSYDPKALKAAPDRLRTPDLQRQIVNRATASWALKRALMWPSGTIGTAGDAGLDALLTHVMGATRRSAALSTTVASGATTTGCVLTSASGLAVNDPILINVAGDQQRVVFIQTISTNTVTWLTTLPTAPTAGDVVKSGVLYMPATDVPSSFSIGHYLGTSANVSRGGAAQTFNRQMTGCIADTLDLKFDANSEPELAAGGPGKAQATGQTEPGAFTTVGANIPSGITGAAIISAAAYAFMKASIALKNNSTVRNADFGASSANGYYRRGQRDVKLSLDAYVEDPAPIYNNALSGTAIPVLIQNGATEGQIWAVFLPKVRFELPSTPDGDAELVWSFKGTALGGGTPTGSNDEIFIAMM